LTPSPVHILAFSGSLRRASANTGLLRAAAEVLPEDATMEIFDLSPIPLYNADVQAAGWPAPVQDFKSRIAAADALLIATPEYNYSIPGVLKNAIDWASRPPKESPLNGKPVALMGAGGVMGTVRSQLHLRQVLLSSGMFVLPKPELYVANAREKFGEHGTLSDDAVRDRIRELLLVLTAWVQRFR